MILGRLPWAMAVKNFCRTAGSFVAACCELTRHQQSHPSQALGKLGRTHGRAGSAVVAKATDRNQVDVSVPFGFSVPEFPVHGATESHRRGSRKRGYACAIGHPRCFSDTDVRFGSLAEPADHRCPLYPR
jgi:hypothetical protein